jgi:hypothetical protein
MISCRIDRISKQHTTKLFDIFRSLDAILFLFRHFTTNLHADMLSVTHFIIFIFSRSHCSSSSNLNSCLVGLALILFQFFLYETVINNCCVKTAAGTFFGLIVVSSVAIFIFPIATSLVSSSGPSISDDSGKINGESWQRSVTHANYSASGTVTGSNYESYSQDPYDMYIRQLFYRESSINSSISNQISMTNTSTSTMDGSNTVHSPLFGPVVTPWVIFITIAVSLTFYRVSATSAFTTLGIVVNESVDKDMRGINNAHCHMLLSVLLCVANLYYYPFESSIVLIVYISTTTKKH